MSEHTARAGTTRAADTQKRTCKDRLVYSFPLAALPGETRRAALVLVWHHDGAMDTHFVPDIAIVQNYGEVAE